MMKETTNDENDRMDASDIVPDPVAGKPNRDPLTGARGAHPMGVGVGAATAGAVGGVIGSAVPVIGTALGVAVGTAVGALVGGFAGKGAAEVLFPTEEESFWRQRHEVQPGSPEDDFTFDRDYLAAYRFGYINSYAYGTLGFDEVEAQLQHAWEQSRDASRLNWPDARVAARQAWNRARSNRERANQLDESAT